MSVAPVIQLFLSDDITEIKTDNPLSFGSINAGSVGNEIELHVWNDKGGTNNSATLNSTTITTLTATGQTTGDTNQNGQELVTGKWLQVKSVTNEDTGFSSVGGDTTKALADIASNAYHTIKLRVNPDINSNGLDNISFEIKVEGMYSNV